LKWLELVTGVSFVGDSYDDDDDDDVGVGVG
jgi:hypothetical protein